MSNYNNIQYLQSGKILNNIEQNKKMIPVKTGGQRIHLDSEKAARINYLLNSRIDDGIIIDDNTPRLSLNTLKNKINLFNKNRVPLSPAITNTPVVIDTVFSPVESTSVWPVVGPVNPYRKYISRNQNVLVR